MRTPVIVLSVAFVASSASALWLWRELRAERALNAELSASTRPQRSAHAVVAAPPRVPAPTVPSPAPAVVSAVSEQASGTTPRQVQGTEADWQAYQRRLMSDPKYREAWKAQQRLNYAPRRANLVRVVGLTDEQAEAIVELTVDLESRWQERVGEISNADFEREQRALDENLQAMLGDTQYARYQGYMETRASRMQVDRLRTQLDGANSLRDDQVEPLISALHAEQAQMKSDIQEYRQSLDWDGDVAQTWRQFYERQAEIVKAAHGRMHTSASAILSPAQLHSLDTMLQRDLARLEAEAKVNRVRSKIDQAGPVIVNND